MYKRPDSITYLLKYSVSTTVFLVALYFYAHIDPKGVFFSHLNKIVAMDKGENFPMHFGVPFLTIAFKYGTRLPWQQSFSLILSFHVVLTYWAIAQFLEKFCADSLGRKQLYLLSLALMVFGPIGLPLVDERVYNFSPFNRYILLLRNSTYTVAQPYVILAFTWVCSLIANRKDAKSDKGTAILAAASLWLSALMKPNFAISFIPALAVFAIAHSKSTRLLPLLLAVVLPTCVTLVAQYYIGFIDNPLGQNESFVIDPWVVWRNNNVVPLLSLLLMTLFPLYVTAGRWREIGRLTMLAWLNFGIALLPFILLRETNPFGDRNFEWGIWFGVHILFLASARDWLQWRRDVAITANSGKAPGGIRIASRLLGLHVFFGCLRLCYSLHKFY